MNTTATPAPTLADFQAAIAEGLPAVLPAPRKRDPEVPHAPIRKDILTAKQKELALANAWHLPRPTPFASR